jgi:hypothetical protein
VSVKMQKNASLFSIARTGSQTSYNDKGQSEPIALMFVK